MTRYQLPREETSINLTNISEQVYYFTGVKQALILSTFPLPPTQTLGTVFILRQVTGNFKEAILPYISDKLKVYKMTYKTASQVTLDAEGPVHQEKDKQESQITSDGTSETLWPKVIMAV